MTTGILAVVVAGAMVVTGTAPPSAADTISVRPRTALSTVAAGAIGVNEPLWSPVFTDPRVPGLIRQADIRSLEFNGGGVSDLYHFRTGTEQADPDPDGHPDYASIPPA